MRRLAVIGLSVTGMLSLAGLPLIAETNGGVLEGRAAFGDWRADKPGTRRLIRPQDLPPAAPARKYATIVHRTDQEPVVARGFAVNLFASGLVGPRIIRTAPNGDIFVAESTAGRISVLRPNGDEAAKLSVFASGLNFPFGIAFYPPGLNPQWVYVAQTNAVLRFPYRNDDLAARGMAETVLPGLPAGGHETRDVAFSLDGTTMYVSVGSNTNAAWHTPLGPELRKWISDHPLGAMWGDEKGRADILASDPQGKNKRIFATGIRNCVSMVVTPPSGTLWCSVNERDELGEDVPPDYVTRVRDGAFYGWPWYYIGANEDPHHPAERPDLKNQITVPDVLLQAHSAPLGITLYDASQFPASYRGNIFVAEHGSWNRSKLTGYKIIRVICEDGVPTGEYEDFVTGFVINDSKVWGRPVGVTVAKDGALLISEDASGTIWRVSFAGNAEQSK